MINVTELYKELEAAAIDISGCNADGVVWDVDGNEIQNRADVIAVLATHPQTKKYERVSARSTEAEANAKLVSVLATVTIPEAEVYITNNVIDLASAKQVLILLAKMVIAMRDKVFPELPEA